MSDWGQRKRDTEKERERLGEEERLLPSCGSLMNRSRGS